jgi:predicted secreted Zn-dependent protease
MNRAETTPSGIMSVEDAACRTQRRRLQERFEPVIASVLAAAERLDKGQFGAGQLLRVQVSAFQCGLRGVLPDEWKQVLE